MTFKSFDHGIADILHEWNKAEGAVKTAEQINGEVINPAIYELRYAGRRIVEALACKDVSEADALSLLKDAHFDCRRARHDAIDAATSKIAADMDTAQRKLKAKNVIKYFPDYFTLVKELAEARRLIAVSREDRQNRDAIYDTVDGAKLDTIVDLYLKYITCEEAIKGAAKQDRRVIALSIIFGALGIVAAVVFGVLGLIY